MLKPGEVKQAPLCGRCINAMQDAYKVQEKTCRQKVDCWMCHKRRYGAVCRFEPRKEAAR